MKISIIIPVYFYNQFVENMFKSVCNQTFASVEIVVVGNGMTEETFNQVKIVIDKIFKNSLIDVRYIYTEKKGANNARMVGYNYSNGEYVFFMDSDDQFTHNYALEILSSIVNKQDVDIVSVNLQHALLKEKAIVPKNIIYKYIRPNEYLSIHTHRKEVLKNYGTNICARLIKRDLLKDIHFLDLPYSQDWNVSSKLFLRAKSFYFVSEPLYYWVYREDSISKISSMTIEKHNSAFNSILDIVDFYKINKVQKEYQYFLNDRIIKFCLRYIDRGSLFDINAAILKCNKLIKKEVVLNKDFFCNKRLVLMYLMVRFKFLFKSYKLIKKVK